MVGQDELLVTSYLMQDVEDDSLFLLRAQEFVGVLDVFVKLLLVKYELLGAATIVGFDLLVKLELFGSL